jgi:HigB_toxin, RelE-like toxic component of a toxin-antitoxin system
VAINIKKRKCVRYNWYKVAQKADWSNLVEVQSVFPSAEAVEILQFLI